MTHRSFISLPYRLDPLPAFEKQDIRYPSSLVRYFLTEFTRKGDRVLDPFAGLGTTLFTAEKMGRVPYGVEYDPERYEWVAGQLKHWRHLRQGDAGHLARFGFPVMDFSMTSPPYMPRHHKWNPLYGGDPAKAGYDVYLRRIKFIYRQVAGLMKKGAYVVVQADNLQGKVYTPLVADLARAITGPLKLEAEIIVAWKDAKPDYPHTHCLLFRKA